MPPLSADTLNSRRAHIEAMFRLYNERAFAVLAEAYAEDVTFEAPMLDLPSGRGRPFIRALLRLIARRFGRLRVVDVFAIEDQVSIISESEDGTRVHFAVLLDRDRRIGRMLGYRGSLAGRRPAAA